MTVHRFNSPYFHDDVFFSECGQDDIPDYCLAYNEHGLPYLKEVGRIPLYSKIQASRSECDLENVLRACVHDNQIVVPSLDYVDNVISDFSSIQSLGDMFVASKQLNSTWNELPLEVRENFNSNVHEFAMAIGTSEFRSKLEDGYVRFEQAISGRLDKPPQPNPQPNPQPQPQPNPQPQPQPNPQPQPEGGVE